MSNKPTYRQLKNRLRAYEQLVKSAKALGYAVEEAPGTSGYSLLFVGKPDFVQGAIELLREEIEKESVAPKSKKD